MTVAPDQITVFYLKEAQIESSHQSRKFQTQCRICLGTRTQSNQRFIDPCNCNGSMKYVHEGCFFSWARSVIQKKSPQEKEQLKQKGLACELCKKRVHLIFQAVRECLKKQQFVKQVKQNQCVAIILLVFILISIGTLAFIINYLQSVKSSNEDPSTTGTFFSAIAAIIMTLFMLGGIYMFFTKFVFVLKTQITGFRKTLRIQEGND